MANPYIDSIKQNQNKTQSSSVSSNRYIRSLTQKQVKPKKKVTPKKTEQLFGRFGISKPSTKTPSKQFSDILKPKSGIILSKVKPSALDKVVKFGVGTLVSGGAMVAQATDFIGDYLSKGIDVSIRGKKESTKRNDLADRWKNYYQENVGKHTDESKEFYENLSQIDYLKPSEKWEKSSTKEKFSKEMIGETLLNIGPGVVSSLGMFAVSMPLGFIVASASVADEIKEIAIENDVPEEKALTLGLGTGLLVGWLEKIVPDEVFSQAQKKEFVSSLAKRLFKTGFKILKTSGKEAGTEVAQETIQLAVEATLREDLSLDEATERLAMSALGGVLGGAGVQTMVSFVNSVGSGDVGGQEVDESITPGTYESQEILDKVINSSIQETKPGKTLIKEAIQAKQTGQKVQIGEDIKPLKPKTPYKSADEFIRAQGEPLYHGTSSGGLDNIGKSGFTITKSGMNAGSGISLTPSKKIAGVFGEKGGVVDAVLSKDAKLVNPKEFMDIKNNFGAKSGWDDATQKATDYFKKRGYDGVDFRQGTGGIPDALQQEIRIWNQDVLKTKSQLTDIYNKAQTKPVVKPKPQPKPKATKIASKPKPKGVKPKGVKAKVKAKLVPRSQVPVGEGKIKVSALEARIKKSLGSLSDEQIKEMGLATYRESNQDKNIAKAAKFVTENTEDAMRVLEGKIDAPKGILRNSILIALQNLSPKDMSLDMANRLATLFSTRAGQEIAILRKVNKNLPVNILSDIIQIRTQAVEKRFGGKTIDKITKAKVKKGESMIKAPTNWDVFLREVRC